MVHFTRRKLMNNFIAESFFFTFIAHKLMADIKVIKLVVNLTPVKPPNISLCYISSTSQERSHISNISIRFCLRNLPIKGSQIQFSKKISKFQFGKNFLI